MNIPTQYLGCIQGISTLNPAVIYTPFPEEHQNIKLEYPNQNRIFHSFEKSHDLTNLRYYADSFLSKMTRI